MFAEDLCLLKEFSCCHSKRARTKKVFFSVKRTKYEKFTVKNRGNFGQIAIKSPADKDKGKVVASRAVGPEDEVFIIASNGVIIRMQVHTISTQGPYGTGVKLMAVEDGEEVTAIAPVIQEDGIDELEKDPEN